MHFLIAPDKFKGTLSAEQVATHLARGLESHGHTAACVPAADGGDGTVAAVLASGFTEHRSLVTGPHGRPVEAAYALRGTTAVIETAQASGLTLMDPRRPMPMEATSYGTGELIHQALDAGATTIVLGVGGVATTDGGIGMLTALGARFLDADGQEVRPGRLEKLEAVEAGGLDPRIGAVEVILASDVDNPLTGSDGAAAVYGPQKGAGPDHVRRLDAGLRRLAGLVDPEAADRPGAGAAGGIGFAAMALLGAERRPGIDAVLELGPFREELARADVVVTGEGKADRQTLHGKVAHGVARRAREAGLETWVVCGVSELSQEQIDEAGFAGVLALTDIEPDPELCRANAGELLDHLAQRLAARFEGR